MVVGPVVICVHQCFGEQPPEQLWPTQHLRGMVLSSWFLLTCHCGASGMPLFRIGPNSFPTHTDLFLVFQRCPKWGSSSNLENEQHLDLSKNKIPKNPWFIIISLEIAITSGLSQFGQSQERAAGLVAPHGCQD